MPTKTESWKRVGVVRVTRDTRGRFVRVIRQAPSRKATRLSDAERARRASLRGAQREAKTREYTRKIAKGGKAKGAKRPPAKRETRIGPLETAVSMFGSVRINGKVSTRRYDFVGGSGKDRQHAVRIGINRPPRERFTTVRTRDFLKNPIKYSMDGDWVEREITS